MPMMWQVVIILISGFRGGANETLALLRCYTA